MEDGFCVGNEGAYALHHVPGHWGSGWLLIIVALYSPNGCQDIRKAGHTLDKDRAPLELATVLDPIEVDLDGFGRNPEAKGDGMVWYRGRLTRTRFEVCVQKITCAVLLVSVLMHYYSLLRSG